MEGHKPPTDRTTSSGFISEIHLSRLTQGAHMQKKLKTNCLIYEEGSSQFSHFTLKCTWITELMHGEMDRFMLNAKQWTSKGRTNGYCGIPSSLCWKNFIIRHWGGWKAFTDLEINGPTGQRRKCTSISYGCVFECVPERQHLKLSESFISHLSHTD